MDFPKGLKFTKDHEWAKIDGNRVTVGITAFEKRRTASVASSHYELNDSDHIVECEKYLNLPELHEYRASAISIMVSVCVDFLRHSNVCGDRLKVWQVQRKTNRVTPLLALRVLLRSEPNLRSTPNPVSLRFDYVLYIRTATLTCFVHQTARGGV